MGIRTLVDVISLAVASLATSMVEVGVEWRARQQAPPKSFFMFLVCCGFFAASPRGEKSLSPLVGGFFSY